MSHNIENDESGLLLSVDPIPEHSLNFTAINDDTDNVPADTDTEDEVGDTDTTDDTDTDTVDDADGTD
jgi:hypothetical protein